jgi:hypothetical protein
MMIWFQSLYSQTPSENGEQRKNNSHMLLTSKKNDHLEKREQKTSSDKRSDERAKTSEHGGGGSVTRSRPSRVRYLIRAQPSLLLCFSSRSIWLSEVTFLQSSQMLGPGSGLMRDRVGHTVTCVTDSELDWRPQLEASTGSAWWLRYIRVGAGPAGTGDSAAKVACTAAGPSM